MNTWFDDIGMTYAKNFEEVEAARSAFNQQRQAILDTLVRVCESAFESTTFTPRERAKPEGGWERFWLTGAFSKAKQKEGAGTRQSAVSFGFGNDDGFANAGGGCFGFGVYVLFKISKKRFEQLRPALTSVGIPFDYYVEDSGTYLRSAWFKPSDDRFSLDAFEDEVLKLPEVFAKADEVIGAAYDKLEFR